MDTVAAHPGHPGHPAEEILLGFTRALRAAGVPVTQDRAQAFLAAVALVGLDDRAATFRAGRATLCGSPEDVERYEQVFREWFEGGAGPPRTVPATVAPMPPVELAEEAADGEDDGDAKQVAASSDELLRHRDVATLSAAEKQRLAALFASLRSRPPRRRTPRREPWHRGDVDPGRTLRASLRRLGEPAVIERRRRRIRARRVVLLVDVSGSMGDYADALLRLCHRVSTGAARTGTGTGGQVEVFTLGTRLTRITRALRLRDPDRALAAAGEAVPDWSGGTRLGETLQAFLDRWGARGLARGAVVVVFSDGWERGDAALLAEQAERLHRIAHRVVWVNPHRGKEGYAPVQQGVLAVLPHVDDFLAGHSLATFARLLEVIGDA